MSNYSFFKQFVMPALILIFGVLFARYLLHSQMPVLAQGSEADTAAALGTSFTFQGTLTDGDLPADGTYDFQFFLFTEPAGGSQVSDLPKSPQFP